MDSICDVELQRLMIEDVKKGDFVAVPSSLGGSHYGTFYGLPYTYYIVKQVSRVTPKKTKVFFVDKKLASGEREGSVHNLYDISSEEALTQARYTQNKAAYLKYIDKVLSPKTENGKLEFVNMSLEELKSIYSYIIELDKRFEFMEK